ncbi:transcription antitermination factor NusB [Hufsiella ginkgonis]|uniref:Transcription antitermination factor NusB n=1 Tax=Hufsiella ginkgonis TaxID=2695274 RepID=A0A7K1XZH1_9SPHI|nr:transcription antitermination factor NusB [Hufsiella ginkgonis]MXV16414.1 transcription antitermination factor NusB [Hufsiella ginkgonis]
MLNRRHLRVKVLQVLYAYHQSENKQVKTFEKSLLQSVDEVYQMYIWVLSLLIETADYVVTDADERANKYLPSEGDLNANLALHNNKFINALRTNPEYLAGFKKYKVSWSFDPEIVRTVFSTLRAMPEYGEYLVQEDRSIRAEKDIIKVIFKKIILKNPVIEQVFEEKFINWPVDKEVLQALIAKTFKNFSSENPKENKLAELCPNWEEDRQFIVDLFNRCVAFDSEYQALIAQKTKNWESDRIAMIDTLLMKMAVTELVHFSSIPVKVTINEYIEISKEFSTPKSNTFINGILDKIYAELKAEGKVRKFGRGLLE